MAPSYNNHKSEEHKSHAASDNSAILYNSIRDAVLIVDKNRRITDCNPAFTQLFGYSLDEIHGKTTEFIYRDKSTYEKMGKKIKEIPDPDFIFTISYKKKNGNIFPGETSVFPLKNSDGKQLGIVGMIRDISKQLEAEELVKNEEKKYRTIFHESPIGILHYDIDGEIIDCNKKLTEILGTDKNKVIGMRMFEVLKDKAFLSAIRNSLTNGSGYYEDIYEAVTSGKKNPVRARLKGIKDDTGKITSGMGLVEDTTETEQRARELRKSEEKYRLIVENQTDMLVKTDLEGRFLFVSPSYCAAFGKSEDELLGKKFMPLVHEDDREYTEKAMQDLHAPPHTAYLEQRAFTKDGWRWLAWVDTGITNNEGRLIEIMGVGRDITAQKEAEHKLADQQRQLSSLISSLPGFVYRCKNDEFWTMLYISKGCKTITGYGPEALTNNETLAYNDLIEPEYREAIYKNWQKAIQNKTQYEGEYQLRTADNELRWIWERGRGVYDENNNLLFLEGYIEDITKRKQAQSELQKLRDDLKRQVSEKTGELQERIAELERFHRATIEREFRIKELTDEIERLKEENNRNI
ncbi:MAG: PAS domain S-box protein [Bacteroidota bacterium]